MNAQKFLNNFLSLIKSLILLVAIFSLSRGIFFLINLKTFSPLSSHQVLRAFFFGIRLDLVVIYYLNFLYLIFGLIFHGSAGKIWHRITGKILFVTVNAILLFANIIDTGYFAFTNKRSGWEMLQMLTAGDDVFELLPDYIKNFWYLAIIWIVFIVALILFYPRYKEYFKRIPQNFITHYLLVPISIILFMGLGFAVARGLEGKPIRIITANKYVSSKYVPLVLNTPFTIINTVNQYSLKDKSYFPLEEISDIYSPVQQYNFEETDFNNRNVVIIILESFGKEYVDYMQDSISYTPFLDSLFSEGLYFENAFTNAYRSIDALPPIMAGFPSMMNTNYINSAYSVNTISSLASILRYEKKYRTAFFHGGNNGTMGFDFFCKAAGIEDYHGATEFDNDEFHDGSWGIFDEEFFQYMNQVQDNYDGPFLSILFSLSSHDPYPIPEKYKGKFPEGSLPILKSVAYTDFALRKMFQTASKMDWYNNTLFVFCADHTSKAIQDEYKTKIGRTRMPLAFYCPSDTSLWGKSNAIVQQLDIPPSVLDYLKYNKAFVGFGKSVFRDEYKYSISYTDINYQIVDSAYSLLYDGEKSIALYRYTEDLLLTNNLLNSEITIRDSLERTLEAYIQNYTYRMNKNSISEPVYISDTNQK